MKNFIKKTYLFWLLALLLVGIAFIDLIIIRQILFFITIVLVVFIGNQLWGQPSKYIKNPTMECIPKPNTKYTQN